MPIRATSPVTELFEANAIVAATFVFINFAAFGEKDISVANP